MKTEEIRLKYQASGTINEEEIDFIFTKIEALKTELARWKDKFWAHDVLLTEALDMIEDLKLKLDSIYGDVE